MRSEYEAFIHYLVKRWTESDACQQSIEGCTPSDLEDIKRQQNVKRLPALYEAFMLHMGRNLGGLGSLWDVEIQYPNVLTFKTRAAEMSDRDVLIVAHDPQEPLSWQCETDEDDPIVYRVNLESVLLELDMEIVEIGRMSEWLLGMVEGAIEEMAMMNERD